MINNVLPLAIMTISERDIKLLWGKAASRCAFPNCRLPLTQDCENSSSSITIGEQAHIVAEKENGSRGNSLLTDKERNSYDNLILLCPTHHTIIDKNPKDFPVEKLHAFKTEHELWVLQTLSQSWDLNQQARDIIYTSLIDAVVEYCHLSQWQQWTSRPLEPIPRLDYDLAADFFKFHLKVFRTDFPSTLIELERSIKTLDILLHRTAEVFRNNAEIKEYNDGKFYYDGHRFQDFDVCYQLVIDATKAANWFRAVVRRDINPMFFAEEGEFIARYPWSVGDMGFSQTYLKYIYTQEEKDYLPDSLTEDKSCRDIEANEIDKSLVESDFEDDF